ncbi:hypothetical protein LUZ60_002421 [Juncus effusus]|nr:hypothetical protein LUZ60_002421 [Juncus effusus]
MEKCHDRAAELKAFDETKTGVKGLVDSGITQIPLFFVQPPEEGDKLDRTVTNVEIPVIDLAGVDCDAVLRAEVVEQVKRALQTMGFFQVVNHGIPVKMLDEMLEGVRRFYESETKVKKEYYTRDSTRKVVYNSNFDLYQAPAANWRDTMFIKMRPDAPEPNELPIQCREITFEYAKNVQKLGTILFQLLSEALGLESNHLIEMECNKGLNVLNHYYPSCPEPHLTVGTTKHSDSDFFTVLLQDNIGGLQVCYENKWIDVPPLHGGLVINIGDLLQLVSNDKLKSVEHRVLASKSGPRVSVACFFSTHLKDENRIYGPIKELISDKNPPLYKETTVRDFTLYYNRKGLDGKSALDYFRL